MKSCGVFVAVAACALGCDAIHLHSNASTSATMLVAGVSSPEEMCLLESAGRIGLESCAAAIAAGDGRELWSLLGGGQLMNVVSKRCAGASAGAITLSTSDCEGASTWKFLPNGQAQVGDKCLSQAGEGSGTENVAAHVAAAATSSANFDSHAAAAAVDTDDTTFWASRPGVVGPIALTIDFGEARSIDLLKILWEFPAQSFAVSVAVGDSEWTEVFATVVNMVRVSRIPLGLMASKVRVDMKKPHPLAGTLSDQLIYGIRTIVALAPRFETTLDDCTAASHSKDARDKYFPVVVPDFDPTASAALRAELPPIAAAMASLSVALGDIVALPSCDGKDALLRKSNLDVTWSNPRIGGVTDGHGDADVKLLLATARSMIVGARDALQ